jgi:FkbM family methyltransferase
MATIGEIVGFKVVAIEPNPRTVRVLRRNLQGYHCATVIEGAASNRGGEITMGSSGIASGTFRVQKTNKREEILPDDEVVPHIKCFRLDQLDFENTNLVFKIDVEGHETEVLESMNGLLTKNQVKAVMIDGFDDKSIPCKLISFGFKLFDGRSLCPFNNRDHFNLLAVHESEVRKNQGVLE